MQVFFAERVEVDRCMFCGGLWFEGTELERVAGRAIPIVRARGITQRRCPACRLTMDPGRFGTLAVERCGTCQSIYLDEGELEQVARREIALRKPETASAASELTFRCGGCGTEKPLDEGATTVRGMACGNCYGAMNETPAVLDPPPSPIGFRAGVGIRVGSGYGVGSTMNEATAETVAEVIGGLLRMFKHP